MGETGLRPADESSDSGVSVQTPEAIVPAGRPSPAYRREWPGYGRQVEPPAGEREPAPQRGWFGPARSARTRILASYVVLLAVSAIVSILAIRQVLVIRLDDQVADALQQEMLELDRLLVDGRDPETGNPFESLRALFDVYFARNVAGDDEGMLAFVDGQLYRSTLARYPLDHIPEAPQGRWEQLSSRAADDENSATGRFGSDLGEAHFRAIRIAFRGGVGAFVVTILPQAEREEIAEFQIYGAAATLGLLLIASVFAYLVAGRVLSPVRNLTETARSISQSDLTKRIEVRGGAGDAAEMAQTFNAMLDRLEKVFRSQRDFVHDASHELRDPLTICRGHLELMGDDPAEQRAATTLVLDELDRMARIVNDLQLLADAEHPDFLQPEWIDLELFGHELTAKATALGSRHWRLESSAEGMIVADRHRLTEALMNLAHNAVQHTEEGDAITFGTALSDEEARLWVRDVGSGIGFSDQSRIFDRFVRGADSRERYRGGGLGLAIVSKIAAAHGGRVELESSLGEGSVFTIVIPREPGERDPRWHGF